MFNPKTKKGCDKLMNENNVNLRERGVDDPLNQVEDMTDNPS